MRNIRAILRKELGTYFASPMAYIMAGVFLALTGVFFVNSVDQPFAEASVRGLLATSSFFLLTLVSPLLTMRLFAEEQKLGTLELLLTAPVRDYEVVVAKFLASFVMLASMALATLFYAALLAYYADPDLGPTFSAYVGFLLYGAATLAMGLLASTLSSNQIVAAVVGFGLILVFTLVDQVSNILSGTVARVLERLSLSAHFDAFNRGVIDTADIAYFLILMAVFLFLTIRSVESRRWR
ncbi:MAG: ABC transporter permease subunit [Chloroflexi bacterium]|nr:ABC transporter permease subunit [Chloroflexota bacterium]